jgi:mono/diheme cytochrome c family protein
MAAFLKRAGFVGRFQAEHEEIAMTTGRMFVVAVAALGMSGWSFSASADAAAGKATFEKTCAECHEAADFAGEDVKGLTDSIKKIVAGQMKHKSKLTLSDAEIANVAAYMSSGK